MRGFFRRNKEQFSVLLSLVIVLVMLLPVAAGAKTKTQPEYSSQEPNQLVQQLAWQSVKQRGANPIESGIMLDSKLVADSLAEETIPVTESDRVTLRFSMLNHSPTTQKNLAVYGVVPYSGFAESSFQGEVTLESLEAPGGTVYYYHQQPPAPETIHEILLTSGGWDSNPAGATAFYIEYPTSLITQHSLTVTATYQLNLQENQNQTITNYFTYITKAETDDTPPTSSDVYSSPVRKFSTKAYAVSFLAGDQQGIANLPQTRSGLFGSQTALGVSLPETVPTKEGKEFSGWSATREGTEAIYQPGDVMQISAGNGFQQISLYPVWKADPATPESPPPAPTSATVTFDPAGGSVTPASGKHTVGEPIVEPTATKRGFSLVGWFTDPGDLTTQWNFETGRMPATDFTLTAVWQAKTLRTVTFNPAGGTASPSTATYYSDDRIKAPTASRTGYLLEYWQTLDGTPWDFDVNVMPERDLTLEAVWIPDPNHEYTVTFSGNGGTVENGAGKYKAGSLLLEPTATRINYLLDGWFKADGTQWDFKTHTMPAKDLILTARWSFDSKNAVQTIEFNGNGATSGVPGKQTIKAGQRISQPRDPYRKEYTFTGWQRLGQSGYWDFSTPLEEEHFETSFVLVAKWLANTEREVIVQFDTGRYGPHVPSQKIMPGNLAKEPIGVSMDGYDLTGWYYRLPNGSRVPWNFEKTRVPDDRSSITIYASWYGLTEDRGRDRKDTDPFTRGERSSSSTSSAIDLGTGKPQEIETVEPGGPTGGDTIVGGETLPGETAPAPAPGPGETPTTGGKAEGDNPLEKATNYVEKQLDKAVDFVGEQVKNTTPRDMKLVTAAIVMLAISVVLLLGGLIHWLIKRRQGR